MKRCSTRGAEVCLVVLRFGWLALAGGVATPLAAAAPVAAADEPRRKVPLYTNEDLDRVSPYRDQTGGSSQPASPAGTAQGTPARETRAPSGPSRAGGEDHWRRSWERLQDQLQPIKDRAEAFRVRIEERRRKPGVRPYSDPQIEGWQRQRDALLARVHDREDRFHEQARRAGALPGWFR